MSIRSEKKTDLSGKTYTQHYENGKPVGRSYVETDQYTGKKQVVHYNEEGRRYATSQRKTDYWTEKEYVETNYESTAPLFSDKTTSNLGCLLLVLLAVVFVAAFCYFTFA